MVKGSIAHATAIAALGVLPSFLTGGLLIQLRHDLGIGTAEVGLATASLFVTSAVFAPLGARLGHRLGTNRAIILAPLISALALGMGTVATSFGWLLAAMSLGGAANAIAQPVSNLRLAEFVSSRRLGVAFGLKQAAVPAAALFSGIAIPTIAITVGWRWVWLAGAVTALGVAALGIARRHVGRPAHVVAAGALRGHDRLSQRTMLLLTIGAFLAATVGTSVGVFFVDSAVAVGFSPASAGLLYAGSSAVAIATRVLLGWYSDRRPGLDSYLVATCLLGIGIVGNLLFAVQASWAVVVGALLSYVLGWAWPGLLQWSVVRDNRLNMAPATGFFQSGSSLGAGVGPIFFGALVGGTSYRVGWLAAAALGVVAMLFLALGTRAAGRERAEPR